MTQSTHSARHSLNTLPGLRGVFLASVLLWGLGVTHPAAIHAQALDMSFHSPTPKTTTPAVPRSGKPSPSQAAFMARNAAIAKGKAVAASPSSQQTNATSPHTSTSARGERVEVGASDSGNTSDASVSVESSPSMATPISATISKTLYLPPAMYGQWSVSGRLMETNAKEYFSTTVNDIWILEREGDQVVISNPTNGASAAISVDRVEGNRATFHREGSAGRNKAFQEMPTITVMGDMLTGQSINKIFYLKDGSVNREYYAIYQLTAQRIGTARTRFRPEEDVLGPDLEIDEIRH